MKKLSTSTYIIIGFGIALCFVGYFVLTTYRNMQQTERESRNVKSALETMLLLEGVLNNVHELESVQRGYVLSPGNNSRDAYDQTLERLKKDTARIGRLELFDSTRWSDINRLQQLITQKIIFSNTVIDSRQKNGYDTAAALIQTQRGFRIMDSIKTLIVSIEENDRVLLGASNINRAATARATATEFFIMAIAFFLILVTCFFVIDRNIKRRSIAESLLRYNASLVQNVSDAIFSTDTFFTIKSWNHGAEHIYGWTAEEAIGKNVETLLHTAHIKASLQELTNEFKAQGFVTTEVIQQSKSGKKLDILVSASALLDDAGNVTGTVVLNRDITERKNAEMQIAYLAGLVAQSGDAIISTDLNFIIQSWNHGAEAMYGYREAEVLGENFLQQLQTSRGVAERDKVISVLISTGYFMEEMEYRKKDGSPITVQASYSVMRNTRKEISGCVVVHRDITEKKLLEKQLRKFSEGLEEQVKIKTRELSESEEKYRSMIEQASEGVIIYSLDGRIHEFNSSAQRLCGYSAEELAGLSLNDLLVEDIVINQDVYARLLSGKPALFNRQIRVKSGSILEVELNAIKLKNDTILAFVRDITERKRIESIIRESEEKYRTLVEQASDGILIIDLRGTIQEVNNSMCRIAGYRQPEMLGRHISDFIPEGDQFQPQRLQDLIAGKPLLYERKLKCKDGRVMDVEINAKMASPHTIIGFVRDITERYKAAEAIRLSEEKFRTLVEQASDGIFISDQQGKYIEVNDSACRLLGYSREELLQLKGSDILSDDADKQTLPARYEELLSGKSFTSEKKLRRRDGSEIFVETNGKMLRDGRFMGILRDITERKRAAEKLLHASERYREIVKATNDGLWEMEIPGRASWWSDALYKICGMDPAAGATENAWISKVHSDDKEMVMKNLDQVLDNHLSEWAIEYRMLPDGIKEIIVLDRGFVVYDEQQNPLRVFGSVTDITERKHFENSIRKSEENFRTIIEQASDGIFIVDKQMVLLEVNEAACKLLGYSRKELMGLRYNDLMTGEELARQPIPLTYITGNETVFIDERKLLRKDGTEISVEISAKVLTDGRYQAIARDVTQRRLMENALMRSQENYASLVNTIEGIVWEADAKTFRFNFISRQAEKLFGYPVKDWTSKPDFWTEHIHQADRDWVIDYCRTSTDALKAHQFEYRMMAKDGRVIWLQDIVTVIAEEGRPVQLRGIMVDITERKKAEAEIQKANELFNLVTLATSDIVWDLNLQDFSLWWNDNFYRMLGYARGTEEIKLDYWIDRIHPSEKDEVVNHIFESIHGAHDIWAREYRFRKANGSYVNIYDRGFIMRDAEGRAYRMIGSMIDITSVKMAAEELERSEEKYRQVFKDNPMPLWMFSLSTLEFLDVNEAAINNYGYSREAFLSMKITDITQPGANGASRHVKKDGSLIDVEISSHDTIYQGEPVRLVLAIDVTGKLQSQELVRQSYEDVRRLAASIENIREEERTSIAREIHDELGQQLTGFKMDLYWLNRRLGNADEEIRTKLKGTLELVDETIKTVRKIATDLRPSILDDLGLVAAMEWQSEEFEKRFSIKVEFTNEIGGMKLSPPVSIGLFRIYQELLTNVARHAHAGKVTGSLREAGGQLYLSVSDDGDGFDVNTAAAKKTLGLLGIKERTNLMGGKYEINSVAGSGTTVLITVPLED